MGYRNRSNCYSTKENGPKYGQMNSDGDGNLKGPSVTPPIMSMCRKDKKEVSETSEKLESHMLGGNQKACCDSLNIVKLELRNDFFPWKNL